MERLQLCQLTSRFEVFQMISDTSIYAFQKSKDEIKEVRQRLDTPRSNGERWIQCSPKVYVSADTSRRESGGPRRRQKVPRLVKFAMFLGKTLGLPQ